eukprot:Ihof_evm6s188 gene=Ihof_evmTU6s188
MASKVEVRVLFFARSRELCGCREALITVPKETRGKDLLAAIVSAYPKLQSIADKVAVAVNQEYVDLTQELILLDRTEVAIIPPISGAHTYDDILPHSQSMGDTVWLCDQPISIDHVTRLVGCPEAGAISSFIGTTRNYFYGKKVIRLEYEAYSGMAEKQMKIICRDIRDQFNVLNIAIVHRTGVVPVGEASIMIAISSYHRTDGLEA